jgi:nucleosome binding factor SPN SPT16 subunit
MRCNSCKEEINPKMKFAIARNSCPACGKKIFSQIEFFFRTSLLKILEKNNVNYPEQVNSIVDDIIALIDKQARGVSESEDSTTESSNEVSEISVSESDNGEDGAPGEETPTQEEVDFMSENGVVLGDGSTDSDDEGIAAIREKVAKLKKKVKKTSGPRPITLSGN